MKRALIVGINQYHPPLKPLKGCVNDAVAISSILETHGDGGPNFDIRLLTDVQTKVKLKEQIVELFSGDCDSQFFYFSGHGTVNNFGGYIVSPDAQRYDEGVPMDDILNAANESKAKDRIVILDCCQSGNFGSPATSGGRVCAINEGVSILTACKEDEFAGEINGHGIFTNLLLEALRGGAADLMGHITPGSIYAFIDQALGAWDQRPVFKTNITHFTSLREVPSRIPKELLRELASFFSAPQDMFPLDPSYEDTNAPSVDHKVVLPYAKQENVAIFKKLQKLQSVGLVEPVDETFMYFAAMNSKACKLTALGYHYWRLAKEGRIR